MGGLRVVGFSGVEGWDLEVVKTSTYPVLPPLT